MLFLNNIKNYFRFHSRAPILYKLISMYNKLILNYIWIVHFRVYSLHLQSAFVCFVTWHSVAMVLSPVFAFSRWTWLLWRYTGRSPILMGLPSWIYVLRNLNRDDFLFLLNFVCFEELKWKYLIIRQQNTVHGAWCITYYRIAKYLKRLNNSLVKSFQTLSVCLRTVPIFR